MGGLKPPNMAVIAAEIDAKLPGSTFSGIVSNGGWGYHNSPRSLTHRYSDYSNESSLDRDFNPDYASAFDMSLTAVQQTVVTKRLLDACLAKDPRLFGMREFCGSINGRVTGYDRRFLRTFYNWDQTHTWHIHVSMYRKYCNDLNALKGVRDVMLGVAPPKPVPPPPPVAPPQTHTVKAGETLTSIAKLYVTTVSELARLNGIADPNKISVGQVLRVK